jgi:hypothetical protein
MQKLSLFLYSLIILTNLSCSGDKEDISSKSIFNNSLPKDGMIAEAEQKLGTLYKEEHTFSDKNSGSKFKLVFGALDKESLDFFFAENSVEVKGITLETKERLMKSGNSGFSERVTTPANQLQENTDFIESPLYYDLISKELKGADIGLSFTILPKSISAVDLSSARPSGISWRQQTSLAFCEAATIFAISESIPQSYYLYTQSRGVFWSGSGASVGIITTNGSIYDIGIDGPKYTRFGGTDPVSSKFTVTWYDWESGTSVSN